MVHRLSAQHQRLLLSGDYVYKPERTYVMRVPLAVLVIENAARSSDEQNFDHYDIIHMVIAYQVIMISHFWVTLPLACFLLFCNHYFSGYMLRWATLSEPGGCPAGSPIYVASQRISLCYIRNLAWLIPRTKSSETAQTHSTGQFPMSVALHCLPWFQMVPRTMEQMPHGS
ncbi:hypothetical protein K439DRAFT_15678 [Ramaria rubella]|nr:hypothetical protein K439DRAFT_15678 [Ramaria rubella]